MPFTNEGDRDAQEATAAAQEATAVQEATGVSAAAQEAAAPAQNDPMLALPAAGEETVSAEHGKARTVTVGGEPILLDQLGPVVLNEDGTMSRITNWDQMSDIEQKNTMRIIGKRNKQRREKLLEKELGAKKEEL